MSGHLVLPDAVSTGRKAARRAAAKPQRPTPTPVRHRVGSKSRRARPATSTAPITICSYVGDVEALTGAHGAPQARKRGHGTRFRGSHGHHQRGAHNSHTANRGYPGTTYPHRTSQHYKPDAELQKLTKDKSLRAALNLFRPNHDEVGAMAAELPGKSMRARNTRGSSPVPMHVQDERAHRVPLSEYRAHVESRLLSSHQRRRVQGQGSGGAPAWAGGPSFGEHTPGAVPPEMRRLGDESEVVASSKFVRPSASRKRLHGVSPASDSFQRCVNPRAAFDL